MTGPTDVVHDPLVLIDAYEDGWVEQAAWVEVTSEVNEPALAIAAVEKAYPLEDRPETDRYHCDGAKEWMRCEDPAEMDGPWNACTEDDERARLFWRVEVGDDE